jgi:hypothetical protein
MRTIITAAAAASLLAACGGEAPEQQQQQETAERAAPAAGEYEASWTVASLRSTDKTTPATDVAEGATGTTRGCVSEDGEIDPALFALAGEQCTPSNTYVRGGRVSMQLDCRREGLSGQILQSVTASSTADSIEGEVTTSTYLTGEGDYAMTRTVTARRVGECPPAGSAETAG